MRLSHALLHHSCCGFDRRGEPRARDQDSHLPKPWCDTYPVQVSEHASWSAGYYGRMINAVLAAGGAPPNLVQFVTGYAEAGNALVTGGEAAWA